MGINYYLSCSLVCSLYVSMKSKEEIQAAKDLRVAALVVEENSGPRWLAYYIGVRILGFEPSFVAEYFKIERKSVLRAVGRIDYKMQFWREEDEWNEKWNIIAEFQAIRKVLLLKEEKEKEEN